MASHPELSLPPSLSQVEARLRDKLWRGNELLAPFAGSIPSGFDNLDRELPGGGWPTHGLTELLWPAAGLGEIRLLAHSLKQLTAEGRQIILLAPPHVPHLSGWVRLGVDSSRILLVEPPRPADLLWAIEQSLKSGAFGALMAWLPEERHHTRPEALRRLQLAATGADGLAFLFRPVSAQRDPSPAPLRLLFETPDRSSPDRILKLRILKRRGAVLAQPIEIALPEIRPFRFRATGARTNRLPLAAPAIAESAHALDGR